MSFVFFFFQAEDGIRDYKVTGVQTCALPISGRTPMMVNGLPLRRSKRPSTPRSEWNRCCQNGYEMMDSEMERSLLELSAQWNFSTLDKPVRPMNLANALKQLVTAARA